MPVLRKQAFSFQHGADSVAGQSVGRPVSVEAQPSVKLDYARHATMYEQRTFKHTTPESFAAAMKRLRGL